MPSAASKVAAESCYRRGLQLATEGKNRDYAHALFSQSVFLEPRCVSYAEAMLQNLCESRAKGRFLGTTLLNLVHRRPLAKAVDERQWAHALRIGVELLKNDPWDVATLRLVAQACEGLHYNEVELVYLKQALDAAPKNPDVSRHCAQSLGRMGQFDQAIACWHRVETLRGKDDEAARMISLLAEEKLKYPNGRPPAAQSPAAVALVDAQTHPAELVSFVSTSVPAPLGSVLYGGDTLVASDTASVLPSDTHHERMSTVAAFKEFVGELPRRIPWLETLLAVAAIALVGQLFPNAAEIAWLSFDPRFWTLATWSLLSSAVLLAVVSIRFRQARSP